MAASLASARRLPSKNFTCTATSLAGVFLYAINDAKEHNPTAAMALSERVG
jgi:hypothetical protein